MTHPDTAWEDRLAALWKTLDDFDSPDAFIARLDLLLRELPPSSDAIASFERGAAHDSTGHPELAVPLYERALAAGLSGLRRRRAVIQMSSSLRNLGHPQRAARLLEAELTQPDDELTQPDDELTQAVRAFLALALVDLGREREAVAVSLTALSHYLPRYNRSLARYADELRDTLAP
jgi:tetratricopeptide (TPR) repeat protein